jgi:cobalamin biosynthesis protein CobT
MSSQKRKNDPGLPFKQALALATRALAGSPTLNVTYSAEGPHVKGNTVTLPHARCSRRWSAPASRRSARCG